ncbi:hypothetical protein G4H71_14360 [Rhodococcus triatomae]|uniref:DUF6286 domain-containing protein n=1 Tax=Rhodococcus triatomae TaxID=300028 RepID=A0A1G8NLI6_9NOCA|nr:DUF6286 domain-containing protein [Rhodococcus triatomae]QNG20034.1 hypothetical protein G4H72_16015 [Rhodococcus triatomae]QNG24050.1 hypothetical protein G4H71_14360 [Rhodococcus triatomae]SDI81064.1 hypothetical protein SAMN05444695_111104 [Rhodococcus triatomae]
MTTDDAILRTGREPVRPAAAGYVGALVAIALLAVGVIALRDAAVSTPWLDGERWIDSGVRAVDGASPRTWMVPVGVLLAVAGVLALVVAVKPRGKVGTAVSTTTGVWIEPRDIARLATATAESVPGVVEARSTATRRKVSVLVTTSDDSVDTNPVEDAVNQAFSAMETPPKVRIRTRRNRP